MSASRTPARPLWWGDPGGLRPTDQRIHTFTGRARHRYAARTPYFAEVQRLRHSEEDAREKIRLWQAQRDAEMSLLAERNKSINHTLSAWNRALGYTSAQSKTGQKCVRPTA